MRDSSPADTRSHVRNEVAELLGIAAVEIDDDDDLLDHGLDSIRLMMLADRWRADGGPDAMALMADRRISAWADLLP